MIKGRPYLFNLLALGLATLLSVAIGSVFIPPADLFGLLLAKLPGVTLPANIPETYQVILIQIRLPHTALMALTGELTVDGRTLRVTPEHPVGTAPGVFRLASRLREGDAVVLREGDKTVAAALSSLARVRGRKPAYNLLVSPAGTYLANTIVVHNKGCFLPDTLVRTTEGTEMPISAVRQGDRLLAFSADGAVIAATVRQVLTHEVDEYRIVRTATMLLQVTPEHPFYVGDGTFRTLEALRPGDIIYAYDGFGLSPQRIESIDAVLSRTRVFNLMTDAAHTFFANGIAVHNKGGGGCFAEGTPVLTPRGEVAIERIRPGDQVIAVDRSGRPVFVRVMETHSTKSPVLARS